MFRYDAMDSENGRNASDDEENHDVNPRRKKSWRYWNCTQGCKLEFCKYSIDVTFCTSSWVSVFIYSGIQDIRKMLNKLQQGSYIRAQIESDWL